MIRMLRTLPQQEFRYVLRRSIYSQLSARIRLHRPEFERLHDSEAKVVDVEMELPEMPC